MKTSLPTKQRIVVGGASVEYVRTMGDGPTIVLVNGAGGPIEGWYKVFGDLSALGAVFAYNRVGLGKSAKAKAPQTPTVVVDSLHDLLAELGLRSPYLLVGHSLGGLYVNLFARRFAEEVAGVVLLEATSPDDIRLLPVHKTPLQRLIEQGLALILGKDPFGETAHLADVETEFAQAGPFPPVPLRIVTGGAPQRMVPPEVQAIRAKTQQGLLSLSPQSRQIIARQSGHFPQFSEPAVVVAAIREVVAEIAAGTGIQYESVLPFATS